MRKRLGEPVLSVADRRDEWLDVVVWASGWGECARFEVDARARWHHALAKREP